MRKLLLALLLLGCSPAFAAVSYITSTTGYYSASNTCGGVTTLTPTAGDDLIGIAVTFTSGISQASVTDSQGSTVTTDHAFAIDPTSNVGIAVYRIHNVSAASHAFTVTWAASATANCYFYLVELRGVNAFDSNQTTVADGSSTALLTNSITPSQNGALLIAIGGTTVSRTLSGWTNSYTSLGQRTSGPTALAAYLAQATAGATSSGNTLSSSSTWAALLVSYIPAGSVSCTHAAITQSGNVAVPTASSTIVRLKNGSFGTVDCSTVSYSQPTVGNFGVN